MLIQQWDKLRKDITHFQKRNKQHIILFKKLGFFLFIFYFFGGYYESLRMMISASLLMFWKKSPIVCTFLGKVSLTHVCSRLLKYTKFNLISLAQDQLFIRVHSSDVHTEKGLQSAEGLKSTQNNIWIPQQ